MGLLTWSVRILVVAAALGSAAALAANPSWPTPDRPAYVPGEVVVVMQPGVTLGQLPATIQRSMQPIGRSTRSRAGYTLQRLRTSNQQSIDDMVISLRQQPGVRAAGPNYIYYRTAPPADTWFGQQWGLHNTGQALNTVPPSNGTNDADIDWLEVWDTPAVPYPADPNVIIAIIDDGIDYGNPELSAAMWDASGATFGMIPQGSAYHGWDFADNDDDPFPGLGTHGTHVAGIAAAAANNALGIAGIASGTQVMALKVFSDFGWNGAFTSDIANAILYAAENGADVINMSLGGPGSKDTVLESAIQDAIAAGTVVVAAAGNGNAVGVGLNNDVTPHWPSNFANEPLTASGTISVAATDPNDLRASFSNFGANTVTLGAPGVFVLSTILDWTILNEESGANVGMATSADCAANVTSCMNNTLFDNGATDCTGTNCTWGWVKDNITNADGDIDFRIEADRGAITSYAANANGILLSISLNPGSAGVGRLHLQYDALWDMECNNDYVDVQVSTNGTTWETLTTPPYIQLATYNSGTGQATLCPTGRTHTGVIGKVTTVDDPMSFSHDLGKYNPAYLTTNSLQIRFVFNSNGSNSTTTIPGGFYIKNIRLHSPDRGFLGAFNGTSMATPMVAGVAALVKSLNPTYTPAQIKQAIALNVDPTASMATTTASGGRLNAFKALYQAGISQLDPASATVNGADVTLTVSGVNFATDAIVRWNGSDLATTFVSSTQLDAVIPAANLTSIGTASITVYNPGAVTTSGALAFSVNAPPSSGGGGGGCFIATAAFGTALAPQVGILRVFRDNWLLTNHAGQWFVEQYYRYSPPLADRLRQYDGLRAAVRASLMPLIRLSQWLQAMYGEPAERPQP